MQKIFRIWMILIFILALIAALIVDKSSLFFGFLILPMLVISAIIIIFGSLKS